MKQRVKFNIRPAAKLAQRKLRKCAHCGWVCHVGTVKVLEEKLEKKVDNKLIWVNGTPDVYGCITCMESIQHQRIKSRNLEVVSK
jgi:hypothetical protein